MAFVIRITWKRAVVVRETRDLIAHPSTLERDHLFGRYVVNYDPTIDGEGNYEVTVCDHAAGARPFPSRERAQEYFERASPNAIDRGTGERGWRPLSQQYHAVYLEI